MYSSRRALESWQSVHSAYFASSQRCVYGVRLHATRAGLVAMWSLEYAAGALLTGAAYVVINGVWAQRDIMLVVEVRALLYNKTSARNAT